MKEILHYLYGYCKKRHYFIVAVPLFLACIFILNSCSLSYYPDPDDTPFRSQGIFFVRIKLQNPKQSPEAPEGSRVIPEGSTTLSVIIVHESNDEYPTSEQIAIDPITGIAELAISGVLVGLNEATIQVLDDEDNVLAQRKHCFYMPPGGNYSLSEPLSLGVAIEDGGKSNPENIEIPLGTELFYENWSKTTSHSVVLDNLLRFSHINDQAGYVGKRVFVSEDYIAQNIPPAVSHSQPNTPGEYFASSYNFNICGEYEYDSGYGAPGKVIVNELKPDDPRAKDQSLSILSEDHSLIFGGTAVDHSRHMIQTLDGGFMLVGMVRSTITATYGTRSGDQNAYIVKLDSEGKKEFDMLVYRGTTTATVAKVVRQIDEDTYAIAGTTTEGAPYNSQVFWLFKIERQPDNTWAKTLDRVYGGTNAADSLNDMIVSSDGNIIMTGVVGIGNSSNIDISNPLNNAYALNDIWVIKVNGTTGNKIWDRVIGGSAYGFGSKIIEITSDNYIITGLARSTNIDFLGVDGADGTQNMAIIKLSESGASVNIDWIKVMGSSGADEARSAVVKMEEDGMNGSLVILGRSNGSVDKPEYSWENYSTFDSIVVVGLKTDDGFEDPPTVVWTRLIGGNGTDRPVDIIEHPDGGYVLYINTGSSDGDINKPTYISAGWNLVVTRIDDNGSTIWQNIFGGAGRSDAAFTNDSRGSIIRVGPGKYAMLGYSAPDAGGDTYGQIDSGTESTRRDWWFAFSHVILSPEVLSGKVSATIGNYTVPIPGALVKVGNRVAVTGRDGRYSIHNLTEGASYTIKVYAPGCAPYEREIEELEFPVAEENFVLTDLVSIANGHDEYVLAFDITGQVWGWGENDYGHLGFNNKTDQSLPVKAMYKDGEDTPLLDDAVAIAASNYFSLVIRDDNTVWGMGHNIYHMLGIEDTTDQTIAVQSGMTDAIAVSAGQYHSMALKSNGTVWTWGYNDQGQLGRTISGSSTHVPGQVSGGWEDEGQKIIAIAAGYNHSAALDSSGQVWTWGRNNEGQLGNGEDTTNRQTPGKVVGENGSGVLSDIIVLSSGRFHLLALDSKGFVWAWGINDYQQLGSNATGYPTVKYELAPVKVDGLDEQDGHCVVKVAAGQHSSVAMKSDGSVWTWGRNNRGQLGINESSTSYTTDIPERVVCSATDDYLENIYLISAQRNHAVVVDYDGNVWAWGENTWGQIGQGVTDPTRYIFAVRVLKGLNYPWEGDYFNILGKSTLP
jgi:alpha-tubulin suppressor-like RCC1 family protein